MMQMHKLQEPDSILVLETILAFNSSIDIKKGEVDCITGGYHIFE